MKRTLAVVALVGLGALVGAGSTAVCLSSTEPSEPRMSAQKTELSHHLLALKDRALLLSLLDQGRTESLRKLLEKSLAWDLEKADALTQAGVTEWGFPAFLGESLHALRQIEAYGQAHALDPAIAERAAAIHQRLTQRYERRLAIHPD